MNNQELRDKGRDYALRVIEVAKNKGTKIVGVGPLVRKGRSNIVVVFMLGTTSGAIGVRIPFDNKIVAKAAGSVFAKEAGR